MRRPPRAFTSFDRSLSLCRDTPWLQDKTPEGDFVWSQPPAWERRSPETASVAFDL